MGSSLGGLVSYYAGLKYPKVFGKVGCFSPSFWFTNHIYNLTQNTKKIKSKIDSDWQTYYGSNDELKKDVESLGSDKFIREILYYCNSKAQTSYLEAKQQFDRKVLETTDYYNGQISVRVHGSHIINKI